MWLLSSELLETNTWQGVESSQRMQCEGQVNRERHWEHHFPHVPDPAKNFAFGVRDHVLWILWIVSKPFCKILGCLDPSLLWLLVWLSQWRQYKKKDVYMVNKMQIAGHFNGRWDWWHILQHRLWRSWW